MGEPKQCRAELRLSVGYELSLETPPPMQGGAYVPKSLPGEAIIASAAALAAECAMLARALQRFADEGWHISGYVDGWQREVVLRRLVADEDEAERSIQRAAGEDFAALGIYEVAVDDEHFAIRSPHKQLEL